MNGHNKHNWYKFSQTINENELNKLVNYCINTVWKRYDTMTFEEKYSTYNMKLLIQNEEDLQKLIEKYDENTEELIFQKMQEELERRENIIYNKRKKNQNTQSTETIGTYDEESTKSETPFQGNVIKRLNEIKDWNVHGGGNTPEQFNKYMETSIFQKLFKNAKEVPETIKVYRGVPNVKTQIRQGDYVTPQIDYARNYVKNNKGIILSSIIPTKDLIIGRVHDINAIGLIYSPK